MKKFMFVICLALTALPVFAGSLGQVVAGCDTGVHGSRATVAEISVPAQESTAVNPTEETSVSK